MKKAFPLITITSLVINLSVVFQKELREFFGKYFRLQATGIIPPKAGAYILMLSI